jgi:hypothetical protein
LKEESSFLKKRSKRLLFFGVYVSRATYAKRKKVFWFFSSEKNKPSGPDIADPGLCDCSRYMDVHAKAGRIHHRRRCIIRAAVDDRRRRVIAACIAPMTMPGVMPMAAMMPIMMVSEGRRRDSQGAECGNGGKPAPQPSLS